ncbi:MAG: hypothetical protein EPN41_14830 [Candidimonas sp.]|nr:MAG: hypothetical protein EPN41_14830 [Candidimonas sp.]
MKETDETSTDALLGKIAANHSLLATLLRVVPLHVLQALETELRRDAEAGKISLAPGPLSERAAANCRRQARANLELVHETLANRETH